MKKYLRFSALLLICVMIFSSVTACGKADASKKISYDSAHSKVEYAPSGTVAENVNFSLYWDMEKKCLLMTDKNTGEIWSTTPYESYMSEETPEFDIRALMFLDYIFVGGRSNETTSGASCEDLSARYIDNGIEITFWFEVLKISVPLRFLLTNDGLRIEMHLSDIVEEYKFKVFKVGFAPFFCAVENSKENYIFIPSGSGAVMYTDARGDGSERSFDGAVYGDDPLHNVENKYTSDEPVRMGVFGSVAGEKAMCAIIKNGSEYAHISADVGNDVKGVSNVYAWFQIRGINTTFTETNSVNYYTDEIVDEEILSIEYYPLYGENANYMGFAAKYREYLSEEYGLEKDSDDSLVSFKILGGAKLKNYFLGVPYYQVEPLTTLEQVGEIIETLNQKLDIDYSVLLSGFGESGLDVDKIAGGYDVSSKLGDKKAVSSLQSLCKESRVSLFMDYDVIRFKESFLSSLNAAKNVNGLTGKEINYSFVTGAEDTADGGNLLNKRGNISSAVDKLIVKAKDMQLGGISLGSLGNLAYSDFSDHKYYAKSSIDADTSKELKKLGENGFNVATVTANDYAAAVSDFVFEAVTYSNGDFDFDADIPFYQMVFKGYVSMSAPSVNTAAEPQIQLLKSLESGIAPQFTLVSDYNIQLAMVIDKSASLSVFDDNIEFIIQIAEETQNYLNSVKNCEIVAHYILSENVRKTVFENGIICYINYGVNDALVEGVNIPAMNYTVVK